MKWDTLLRAVGIAGFLVAYLIFVLYGQRTEIFVLVVASIGTLVMPEFIHHLPIGPTKG